MHSFSSPQSTTCQARVQELQSQYGAVLADRIIASELADFLWEGRVQERYLGQQNDGLADWEDPCCGLSRMLVLSVVGGACHVGLCLVDGEGSAAGLLWSRRCSGHGEASAWFAQAR